MGKVTGFLEYQREVPTRRPVIERVNDWFEIYQEFPPEKVQLQGARCMDCGVPFCHTGCPLNNIIPDWNDLAYKGKWKEAIRVLHATNNFPEFTGRLCPAPCEAACVLGINSEAVTIKQVEVSIVDRAFDEGWVVPQVPERQTGKTVAVVGSGPAGLAAAQQLTRAGHTVAVYERDDEIGGLLRYGVPDFKLEKRHIDRRLAQMTAEGTRFRPGVEVGRDITWDQLRARYDAVVRGPSVQRSATDGAPYGGPSTGSQPSVLVVSRVSRWASVTTVSDTSPATSFVLPATSPANRVACAPYFWTSGPTFSLTSPARVAAWSRAKPR